MVALEPNGTSAMQKKVGHEEPGRQDLPKSDTTPIADHHAGVVCILVCRESTIGCSVSFVPFDSSRTSCFSSSVIRRFRNMRTLLFVFSALLCVLQPPFRLAAEEPFAGTQSDWNGYVRYDFEINSRPVLVVVPKEAATGKPWVWHGEFFGHKPAPDIALLGKGFHIVYTQISNQFGSPTAVAQWNQVYDVLTKTHGLGPKAALVGVSRGGLYCYNWASQNPDKVACIYGDAPVCDAKSWPMGKGTGIGSSVEVARLLAAYNVKTEDELFKVLLNPIDSLKPLAEANVPLLHVYGDADEVVPWDENTKVIADRYKEMGGEIILIGKPGIGHVHGLDDSTPIIEFIQKHCL